AIEHRELHERDRKLIRVQAESLQGAFHARYIAVVVGAPDVYYPVEAAFKLVEMICNIGSEIGVLAIVTLDHTVLFISELGRAKPLCAFLDKQVPFFFQPFDRSRDQTGIE